jgi:hypothetical protein
MNAFRLLLVVIFVAIAIYTAIVVANHGFWLFGVFFGDMATLGWAGQFNLDFMCFLALSALWLAWRHHFTPAGFAFGIAGFLGGAFFLSAYLFFASFAAKDDIRVLLLGKARATAG